MARGRNQTRTATAGLATACTALAKVVRFLAAFSRLLVVVDMVVGRGVEHGELSVDGAGNKCSKRSDADGAMVWISDFKLDLLAGGFLHLVLIYVKGETFQHTNQAELAQSVERTTLNRVVEGSIPSFGAFLLPPSTFLLTMGCLLVQSRAPDDQYLLRCGQSTEPFWDVSIHAMPVARVQVPISLFSLPQSKPLAHSFRSFQYIYIQ